VADEHAVERALHGEHERARDERQEREPPPPGQRERHHEQGERADEATLVAARREEDLELPGDRQCDREGRVVRRDASGRPHAAERTHGTAGRRRPRRRPGPHPRG
jgi:hypothetical protein